MNIPNNVMDLLTSCGAPLATFILGLFFPQVRLVQLLDIFSGHKHDDKKE